jgi:pyruvate dehydrogenase E1 component beta subunit|tara:strand:- start:149 stop:1204 length:1056 start_codon:yes stop_codon:yes gene_type:complete
MRELSYANAIKEATDFCLEVDQSVLVIGLGVPDPKGIFGTTTGLQDKYGVDRVMDMPLAENGMTGVVIGASLNGYRPILTHQRVEFALLSIEQLVNQAAKWFYMNAGQQNVPIVIRLIIGRGWGNGAQHTQSLESWFAHIPGLKVVMPSNAYDAKGLLISSVEDNNPVIFIEHRWLHNIIDYVPTNGYRIPIGKANITREGKDVTIVTHSYMVLESIKCAEVLAKQGISVEVLDLRTIRPLDTETILRSVSKTLRVVVADNGWVQFGVSAEIISVITENIFDKLLSAPARVGINDSPSPSTRALIKSFYPRADKIAKKISEMMNKDLDMNILFPKPDIPLDVPDPSFRGPF